MLKRVCIGLVLMVAGCSETHEHGCGNGEPLEFGGVNYCVYEASIIEEGFRCPAAVPNQYDFGDFKACGVPAEPPEDLEEEVYRVFRADAGGGDTCEYNGQVYKTGDVFRSEDGCNSCSCNPDGTTGVGCGTAACVDAGPVDASLVDSSQPTYEDFHLSPVPTDPVSLRLYRDGTFEWMQDGCDFRSGSGGRWAPGAIIIDFLPGIGQASFDWIDSRTDSVVQLETLRGRQETADIEIAFGETTQVWKPGGKCPLCGDLGPTDSIDCEPIFGP